MQKEYRKYCEYQSPPTSSVNQFHCDPTDVFCPRNRKNVANCPVKLSLDDSADPELILSEGAKSR
jgi:hypothetical protein